MVLQANWYGFKQTPYSGVKYFSTLEWAIVFKYLSIE